MTSTQETPPSALPIGVAGLAETALAETEGITRRARGIPAGPNTTEGNR